MADIVRGSVGGCINDYHFLFFDIFLFHPPPQKYHTMAQCTPDPRSAKSCHLKVSVLIKSVKGVPTEHFHEVCCRLTCGSESGHTTFKRNVGTPSWTYGEAGFIFDVDKYDESTSPREKRPSLTSCPSLLCTPIELEVFGRTTRSATLEKACSGDLNPIDAAGASKLWTSKPRPLTVTCPLILPSGSHLSPVGPLSFETPESPNSKKSPKKKKKKFPEILLSGLVKDKNGKSAGDLSGRLIIISCEVQLMCHEAFMGFPPGDRQKGLSRVKVLEMYGDCSNGDMSGTFHTCSGSANSPPPNLEGLSLKDAATAGSGAAAPNGSHNGEARHPHIERLLAEKSAPRTVRDIAHSNAEILKEVARSLFQWGASVDEHAEILQSQSAALSALEQRCVDDDEHTAVWREAMDMRVAEIVGTVEVLQSKQKSLERHKETINKDVGKLWEKIHALELGAQKMGETTSHGTKRAEAESATLHHEVRSISRQLDENDKRTLSVMGKIDFVESEIKKQNSNLPSSPESPLIAAIPVLLSYIVKGAYAPLFVIFESITNLSVVVFFCCLVGVTEWAEVTSPVADKAGNGAFEEASTFTSPVEKGSAVTRIAFDPEDDVDARRLTRRRSLDGLKDSESDDGASQITGRSTCMASNLLDSLDTHVGLRSCKKGV